MLINNGVRKYNYEKKEWKEIKSIPIEDSNNSSLRKVPMLGQMACVELEMTEK